MVSTENPLVDMLLRLSSVTRPFRVKIVASSIFSVASWVLRAVRPDVITILASLYFILGDIDR